MDVLPLLNASLAGRYLIERQIGQGGMATVYLARDGSTTAPSRSRSSPDLGAVVGKDRFLAEIGVTARLQHPHLLPLFDSGEADGQLFYVMPYVQGESLRDRLQREKQLPIDEGSASRRRSPSRSRTRTGTASSTATSSGIVK